MSPEMVPEESELVNRLREIVSTSDLNTTTSGAVRRQLEQHFGVPLSHRKKFISQQIDLILQHTIHPNGDGEEGQEQEQEEQVEEEEEEAAAEEQVEEEAEVKAEAEDDEDEIVDDNKRDEEDTTKKKGGGGFAKVCSLSPQLQELLGVPQLPRTQVVKQLWAYIKENDLQDPQNRRNIKCDQKLHSIFRVDTINMFKMNQVLSKHIWPLEPDEEPSSNSPRVEKKQKRKKEEDVEPKPKKRKEKKEKGGASGFMKPLELSEAFMKFIGTGETSLSRAEAVKRMWTYIKENDLQDPSDKKIILCDGKLKELFDVDKFKGFAVTKYLSPHLIKKIEE